VVATHHSTHLVLQQHRRLLLVPLLLLLPASAMPSHQVLLASLPLLLPQRQGLRLLGVAAVLGPGHEQRQPQQLQQFPLTAAG
jgi:hypothetical protein